MTALSHTASVKVLTDLLVRLEGAESPDRELDFRLHIALVEDEVWPAIDRMGRVINPHSRMSDYLATYSDVINSDDQDFTFGRYTASLDAVLALVERVLPGCKHEIGDTRGKPWCALFPADLAPVRVGLIGFNAYAATEPTAVLCALITTLIANADTSAPQAEPVKP